jgi:hypothetical protein
MPVLSGQLIGDVGGLIGSPVINVFHEFGPRLAIDACHSPIFEQQHVSVGQGDQPFAKRLLTALRLAAQMPGLQANIP